MSIPDEELNELMEWTAFKRKDLKRWYKKFMKNYPDGKMKIADFQKLYEKVYPATATTTTITTSVTGTETTDYQFSQYIFRSFDRENKGFISFKELMQTFSLISCGTKREKLEWSFNLFDVANNGRIALEDFYQIVECVRLSKGNEDIGMSHVDVADLFIKIDKDGDGYWSLQEFIEGTRNYPSFFKKTLKVNKRRRLSRSSE